MGSRILTPHIGRTLRRDERGSTTLFFVVMAIGLLAVVGLVVDGGGKIRELQQANAVAAQAARAGGQAINQPQAVRGNGATVNTAAAQAAAQLYLDQAGMNGHVQVLAGGTRLRVTTTSTYNTVFLGLAGVNQMTVTGDAEVRLVEGIDGSEASP